MMLPNQPRSPFPGPMPVRPRPIGPTRFGGPPNGPGSEMTQPIQRNTLPSERTFARPFSQIGSPGNRQIYPL